MSRTYLNQWLETNKHDEWTALRRSGNADPLVSVVIPTYQHVDFLERCVESVMAQRTNFPFEVLIGEDGSTDGTRELAEELHERYPEEITVIFQPRANNFSINGRPTGRYNLLTCFNAAQGKYIAWCDGDDYFIDETKLARQVERLESNEELIGVWTEFVSREFVSFRPKATVADVFGAEGVWPENQLGASTTMIRREALDFIDCPLMSDAEFFDITFWMRLFKKEGLKGGYLHTPMVNYSIHFNSFFSSMNPELRSRKKFQMRVQALCGGLIDPEDLNVLFDAYERDVRTARRTNGWGAQQLLKQNWFRSLLSNWKSMK